MQEPDAAQQALYDIGTVVGLLAQNLFPGGATISFEEGNFDEKAIRTKRFIESGEKTIYEATFIHDEVLVMVDILHKGPAGWELYEVKASTSVKEIHHDDVAVQYYVLKGCGINLVKVGLIHINNQYIRRGKLELDQLFVVADLTETTLKQQDQVPENLEVIRAAIQANEPMIDIGPHCGDPYECDFLSHCWAYIPEVSIFNLTRLNGNKKWELYNQGVVCFEDLPKDYPLTQAQAQQVEAQLEGTQFIDVESISEFLKTIWYPLYFLDFEIYQSAVPPFDGLRPYEQIPFQFSLHYQESPNSELNHNEFLAKEGVDPREPLAQNLVQNIPKEVCVLAYNVGFEKGVIRRLAEQFPKWAGRLMDIHDNMLDLMAPFRARHVYRKEMNGSYSIKSVLPALMPELTYKDLEIQDGGQASSTYAKLHLVQDKEKVQEIRKNLLAYCKLDTYGMVKLLDKLAIMLSL
ncbi:MAG: DUF2779 domain-containing protein [Nitrospinales bacterium]